MIWDILGVILTAGRQERHYEEQSYFAQYSIIPAIAGGFCNQWIDSSTDYSVLFLSLIHI